MVWKSNEDWSGRELTKVWHLLVPYTRGRVLDVGAGANRVFPHWVTLDASVDYGGQRVTDIQARADRPLMFLDASFDAVVSSHCLEHIVDWRAALAEWWRIVATGGHLCLYLPHADLYPRCGTPGSNPDHKHDFRPEDILQAMSDLAAATGHGWTVLEDETRDGGSEYSFLLVFRKRADAETVYAPFRKPAKSCMVVRLGAFGDQIMAASILPHLKADGWFVTYMSANPGVSVIQHDPHIDAFIIVDKDQIPNERLGEYWALMGERYDRIVNLCESIEGQLLTIPGRVNDSYPDEVRRKLNDVNYLERTHDLAGVPHDFHVQFYPTEAEVERCRRTVIDAYPGRIALWVLSGSSVHKTWPYMPQAIVRLLYAVPDLTIVLAGDEKCQELEQIIEDAAVQYFGTAKRLVRTSGLWPVRGTMTLAQMVDVVIGPETGVLNAVCLDEVPKVVFLSHSSPNMLTKHWTNTVVLTPKGPDAPSCWPCARLHHGWDRCRQDRTTGAAMCQAVILPETAVEAIAEALLMRDRPAEVSEGEQEAESAEEPAQLAAE